MDRLRPRQRSVFTGFTKTELEKMEKLFMESKDDLLSKEFCQKIAKSFSCSAGRAGKPVVKWTEVQSWFQSRQQDRPTKVTSSTNESKKDLISRMLALQLRNMEVLKSLEEKRFQMYQKWNLKLDHRKMGHGKLTYNKQERYDVDMFLAHRFLDCAKLFVGFGADEDEWVNVKNAVRERSVPLEPSDCHKLKVGGHVLCFQERRDQGIHYDAHIAEIHRRMHDIRGCRCLFLVRYNHDNTEERVRLRRLCCRPTF